MSENVSTVTNNERFLLGIPAVATLLIWFWVGNMNLMQSPGSSLMLIGLLTICATAALAAIEVSKTSQLALAGRSPKKWLFLIALLWGAAYPMYMYQRRQIGLPNRLVPACILSLVFCGSWILMNSSIEARKAEVRQNIEEMRSRFSNLGR
ncbi:hypothetical protein [Massilia timonae]|uniref:hypothetical protein n=1 Tax=Massilia timonae TaxID=47229 RepID=UPI0028D40383|nr:hypothetical protein [Massilia timonae]